MSDNVTVDNGALTDYVVSSDEGAGGQVQRVKLAYSADGSETHVTADADGLLVNLGGNNDVVVSDGGGSLTVDGTFWQATQPVSAASLPLPSGAATSALQTQPGVDIGDVTINNASGASAVHIQDGGNSITVDGTVAATQSGTWTVQPGNTANTTAWKVDASSVAVPVTDNAGSLTVDNAGTFAVQATLAAGATAIAKAEDVASADADVGVPAMAVRKATPANTSGTDGDYEFLQMSAGRLWTSATIDAALPAGTAAIGKLAANSGVDIGDVDITSVVPGTAATNLGKAEDAGHTSGDTGVMALAVRSNTPTALAGTDLDYAPLEVDALGQLHVAEVGSATLANNQVAPTNSAATLVAARNGRRRLILLNTGTVTVWVGIATVTTANGFPIDPGASLTLQTTALVQGITASGTGSVAYVEEY